MISSTSIPAWMDQLGWVLVHFLWQGAVIGIVIWLALILLKKASAQIRYLFLCFSLLFCVLSPCLTWVLLDKDNQAHFESAIVPDFSSVKPPASAASIAKTSLASDSASYSVGPHASSRSWSLENLSRIIQAVLPYFVTLWCLGVITLSVRLACGWIQLQNFCASGVPPKDQVWTERLTALANRMGLRLTILLLESALVEVPTVIGWLRPVILVPATFFTGLPPDQIEAILAHELAHIRRYDYLVNLAQIAIETILFYHPVVWWISRAIRQEREHCCDDLALQVVGDKIAYATALAALEESRSLPMAITIAATGGSLLQRIKRIVGANERKVSRWPMWTLIIGIIVVGCLTQIRWPTSPKDTKAELAKTSSDKSKSNGEQLIEATGREDIPEMTRLVKLGTDVNYRGKDDWTPLTKAAASGKSGSVKFLLANGADPNSVKTNWNYSALCLARKSDIAEMLFAAGAKIDAPLFMHYSVMFGSPEKVKWLIAHGVDPTKNHGDHPDQTLLFDAGNPETAEILIQHGVDVKAQSKNGETALDSICMHEKNPVEIIRVLLKYGADPNARDNYGGTPLSYAPDGATVDLLIEHGADVKAKNKNGLGILYNARGDASRMETLIQHGAPFDPKIDGPTLMMNAAWLDHVDVIAYLLKLGVDPNLKGTWNKEANIYMTPLQASVTEGHLDAAKLLLDHGAKVEPQIVDGKPGPDVMDGALYNRRKDIVKLFWEHGVRSISELTYAISQEEPVGEIQKLLDSGIPVDPFQDKFMSPLGLAAELGRLDVVALLVQRGARINDHVAPDEAPLDLAAGEGQDEVVDFLLHHGAQVDYQALWNAVWNCNPYPEQRGKDHFEKTVKMLIDAGTLKKITPEQSGQILSAAIDTRYPGGNATVLKMLLDAGLSPELPLTDQSGKKLNSVIGYYRDLYIKHKDDNGWVTAMKPQLDMLEAADKGSAPKTTGPAPDIQYLMIDAARKGDAVTLQKLFDQGVEYDAKARPNQPTLFFYAGSPEVAELLVRHGVDVNARNDSGQNALPIICYSYQHGAETARVLLKHGADPNAADRTWGQTPLMAAGDGASVDVLMEFGAKLDTKTKDGRSGWAAMNPRSEVSYYDALLKHGLVFDPNKDGSELLMRAISQNQIPAVQWCLDHGVDPNRPTPSMGDPDPVLPLDAAIYSRDQYDDPYEMCRLLVAHGAKGSQASLLTLSESKDTKLIELLRQPKALPVSDFAYAVTENKSVADLKKMLDQGTVLDEKDRDSLFFVAAAKGDLPTVEFLIQQGAKIDQSPPPPPTFDGQTNLLGFVAMGGHDEVLDYLLKHGAKANWGTLGMAVGQHSESKTPVENYEKTVTLLIDAGVLKGLTEDQTASLLVEAIGAGNPDDNVSIMKLLLDAGLNPLAKISNPRFPQLEGKTPIDVARELVDNQERHHYIGNSKPLLELMEKASNRYGKTPNGASGADLDSDGIVKPDDKIENAMPTKKLVVHVQDSDGLPLTSATAKAEGPNISADVNTGTDGLAVISLPTSRPQYLSVRVRKDGFVPKLITWSLDQPSFSLPSDFTLKMEKAQTIGGVVKNDDGQPVAGANVVLIIRGSSMGGMAQQVFNDIWERRVTTDKDGNWHFDEAPSDLRSLQVTLEHPDYISNERIDSRPSDDDFKQQKALLIAHKGVPVEGTVTDDEGKPVVGVDVVFGEAGSGSNTPPNTTTDAAGHFRFGGLSITRMSMLPPILTFTSANYAPEMVELKPSAGSQNLDVQLKPGKRLCLRLTDQQGHPIKDVTLAADHWRGHRPFGGIRFQSDNNGLIVWDHAPDDPITYAMLTESFQNQDLILQPKEEVQTIQLKRQTIVSGRVLDATTKQPITAYDLIFGTYFPPEHPGWSGWARGAALHIQGDSYRYVFSDPAQMNSSDGISPGTEGFHRIRIEAVGYEPGVSRPIANEEESVSIDFQLKPAQAIHGVVTAADGTTVKDAQVVVAGPGNPLQIINGVCRSKWDQLTVNTNAQGEYDLPPQEEDFPIAIIQPDAGYFTTTYRALKTSPNVKLLPWGSIALATTAQNEANPPYYVRYVHEDEASYQKERIHFEVYKPSEYQNGAVIYKQLVAGPIKVGKFMQDINEGQVVQIESGKTTQVDLRTGKNAVIGKIAMPLGASSDSPLTILRLRPVVPDPPFPPNLTQDQRRAWIQTWRKTPEGQAYGAKATEIPFTLDAGGSFRIDDVSPGSYQLIAVFLRSLPTGPQAKADVLGAVQRKFELTTATGDCDLGTLPVQANVR